MNPNEIERRAQELEEHRDVMRNLSRPKSTREYHLGEIRRLCAELGENVPPYNTTAFTEWLRGKTSE